MMTLNPLFMANRWPSILLQMETQANKCGHPFLGYVYDQEIQELHHVPFGCSSKFDSQHAIIKLSTVMILTPQKKLITLTHDL
jgi:hypothetical protein